MENWADSWVIRRIRLIHRARLFDAMSNHDAVRISMTQSIVRARAAVELPPDRGRILPTTWYNANSSACLAAETPIGSQCRGA